MTNITRVVNWTVKGLTHLLCRVDDAQLAQIPERGPLILVANHINFVEVPILYTHLQPRPVTGFAKAETWNNPVLGRLFSLWGGIPLKRGEIDVTAFRRALAILEQGYILAVAPEGTRNNDGRMRRGHPGVVTLALRSGAPLLPMVYYGGECLRRNLSHLRRTDFNIAVGCPFYLDPGDVRVTRQMRQAMTDEIMYQVAALLPPAYRGHYADVSVASEAYLRFPATSESNLGRV